jgi:hypothetical protein
MKMKKTEQNKKWRKPKSQQRVGVTIEKSIK